MNQQNFMDPVGVEPTISSLQMRHFTAKLQALMAKCGRMWTRTTDLVFIRDAL